MPSIHRLVLVAVVAAGINDATLPLTCAQDKKPVIKRRDRSSDEELRKQLLLATELGFDQPHAKTWVCTPISKASDKEKGAIPPDFGFRVFNQLAVNYRQPDWLAMPWRTGLDSQLGKESAERLQVFSVNLRRFMRESTPANDVRPDPDKLRAALTGERRGDKPLEWHKVEAIPTLMQMLQTENTSIRTLLVELLAKIDGKEASAALAQRALFDLAPEVRAKAVQALASRPSKEYRQHLLDGLRWPWTPAVDHAAEAIAALKLKDAVPDMVKMLKEPDARLPFAVEVKGEKVNVIREIVRINHLSNCTLCHALSTSKEDLVRGRIPMPGEEMPPLYYAESSGLFVRADTTFLRQDFSVVQPVATPVKWPGHQRYDYILRTRPANKKEMKLMEALQKEGKLTEAFPQREALLYALREVTGTDLGSRPEAWEKLQAPIEGK